MAALGQASKVTVDKDSTVIVEGAGSAEAIANRVNLIKSQLETTTSEFLTVKNFKSVWLNCLVGLQLLRLVQPLKRPLKK